jgi:hypothetical protein
MVMGSSAGRSQGNRTGEGAERRNTQREREDVDPVFPEGNFKAKFSVEKDFHPFVDTFVTAFCWASIIVMGVLGGITLASWFGVIG